jgi:cytochrome c553
MFSAKASGGDNESTGLSSLSIIDFIIRDGMGHARGTRISVLSNSKVLDMPVNLYDLSLMFPGGGCMRFRIRLWIMVTALIIPLSIIAIEKGNPSKGKEVFTRCAICHGDSGEGKEAIAKMLGATMPALSSKEVQSLDDAALKKVIAEGKGKMKPVSLSDSELADVIAYLRTLKKP